MNFRNFSCRNFKRVPSFTTITIIKFASLPIIEQHQHLWNLLLTTRTLQLLTLRIRYATRRNAMPLDAKLRETRVMELALHGKELPPLANWHTLSSCVSSSTLDMALVFDVLRASVVVLEPKLLFHANV